MAKREDGAFTAEALRQIIHYDPETGVFTWLPVPAATRTTKARNAQFAGKEAGCLDRDLYVLIHAFGRKRPAHRLAWLYMTGHWPAEQVDHINGNKSDNSWVNLREATDYENRLNRPATRTNKCGIKGVSLRSGHMSGNFAKPWQASIFAEGVQHHLGYFETKELAGAAYTEAAAKLHGEFAHKLVPKPPNPPTGAPSLMAIAA